METISNEYLAGVADSDGSFSYNKKFSKPNNKFYYVAQFQITWKHSEESKTFFDLLVSNFGGSYFDGNTHTSYAKTRILKYCATGKACEKICIAVLPHLYLKKLQAEIVLAGAKLKETKWGVNGKPQEVWNKEISLYQQMKQLHGK